MYHCHCLMCRKLHGALFATYFRSPELTFTAGEDAIQIHESSADFKRAFCTNCGSTVPNKANSGTGYSVPAGLMDDDPVARPESHIFAESKAEAYEITDGLPQVNYYGDDDMSRVVDYAEASAKDGVITGGCQCGSSCN